MALGIALTFDSSVEKGLKLKVRKLIPKFVEVTEEKMVGGAFWLPLS